MSDPHEWNTRKAKERFKSLPGGDFDLHQCRDRIIELNHICKQFIMEAEAMENHRDQLGKEIKCMCQEKDREIKLLQDRLVQVEKERDEWRNMCQLKG